MADVWVRRARPNANNRTKANGEEEEEDNKERERERERRREKCQALAAHRVLYTDTSGDDVRHDADVGHECWDL